jgi:hypothetical protein
MQYYKDLFTVNDTGSPWNMIRYFKDYSHGSLDISETQVFGWFQLDKSVNDYNNLGNQARRQLIQWARDVAVAQGIDLSSFYSIVVCTNLWHDVGASIGGSPMGIGVVAQSTTPIPAVLGQEMGHVYGLQHSRIDGSTDDYMDPWDIMSAYNAFSTFDQEFSQIGPGLNAFNMRSRGWLDESRVWRGVGNNIDETIILRPLVRRDLPGFLAAETPGGYLVEFRVKEWWDAAIPRPAILIHRFESGHSYLMLGNSGTADLIAGDSFGDPEPVGPQTPFFSSSFERLDVLSIDPNTNQATLRIRYRRARDIIRQAIDPMALILLGKAYLIWTEIHHPHEPKVADVQAALRAMTAKERKVALKRAKILAQYAKVVEEAFASLK